MNRLKAGVLLGALLVCASPVVAGPRDAAAVMNRCGMPTMGDTTIYEAHTVAGGRRIFKYLRGTLNFNRVENDGWTFTFGEHEKKTNLSADEMAVYMPCLKQGLLDSASDEALPKETSTKRVEASVKGDYKQIILIALGVLVLLAVVYGLSLLRKKPEEDED